MNEWWNTLTVEQQVFCGLAVLGTFGLVIQLLLTLVGLEHGDAVGADVSDHPSGLGYLSLRSLASFLLGIGGTGFLCSRQGLAMPLVIIASLAVGLVAFLSVAWLMRSVRRLDCSGSLDYRNAVGLTGDVYATIPAAMAAPGQVEILLQGRLCTAQAMTRATVPLAPRSKIKVVDLVDRSTLLVAPLT